MRGRASGYGLVLLLVIVSIGVQMVVASTDALRLVTVALQSATLVMAVRVSGMGHGILRAASVTAVVALVASILIWAIAGDFPQVTAALATGLLVGAAPVAIARGLLAELRESREVTIATLAGTLAIYLLAGMFFSFVYGVIGSIDETALFAQATGPTRADELYFSFVTMCTVGYGDLTPAGEVTRAVSVVEMLYGQIYLVTIVALIVSNLGRQRVRN
jgi:ion channel